MDRKTAFNTYGVKEWEAKITFDKFPAKFKIGNETLLIEEDDPSVRIYRVPAINYPEAGDWKNEMYDALFDACKGTEWGKVGNIEI